MSVETISLDEAHRRMKAQGVSHQRHFAFRCPLCSTVQSMASLVAAGAKPETVHEYIAFSCEGRFTDAGPAARSGDQSRKAKERRAVRGCDWTLGGLFQLQKLQIEYPDGKIRPSFEIVDAADAQALEASLQPKGASA
ncbi:VVA0879 family protein [Bosea sp. (in: a-proteobacteria)]|uniref:VVA0879 family protein n=1 Tax=Bosea sp. (in: a-proteobacteria) TaxID=1871050 RepID=UPI003B3A2C24